MTKNLRLTVIFSLAVVIMIASALYLLLRMVNGSAGPTPSNKVVDAQGNVTYTFENEPASYEELEAISDPKKVNDEALQRVHELSEERFSKSFGGNAEMGTFDDNLKRCIEERADKSERECLRSLYSSLVDADGGVGSDPGARLEQTEDITQQLSEKQRQEAEKAQQELLNGKPTANEPAPIQPVKEETK